MAEQSTFHKDYSNLMLEISELSKNEKNPFFKSSYVPLKDVLAEAKKVCLSNNFIFIQKPDIVNDKPRLVTELIHKDGNIVDASMPLVAKDENDPQKLGASLTYMRRYSLTSILGIMEVDDDANEASTSNTIRENKINKTKEALREPF